jgi:hypothetical protein
MASNEWTTVAPKRAAYIPPHLRAKAAADEAKKKALEPINVANVELFPSLGKTTAAAASPVAPATPTAAVSFKKKIEELIALEQRTEFEREAAEAEKQRMMGFVSLPLPVTPEHMAAFAKRNYEAEQREIHMFRLKTCGMFVDETEHLPLPELEEMDRVLLEED